MTAYFLSMYRKAIARLQQQIQEMEQMLETPPDEGEPGHDQLASLPELIAAARSEIAELEAYLPPLEAFEQRMDVIEEGLETSYREYLQSQSLLP